MKRIILLISVFSIILLSGCNNQSIIVKNHIDENGYSIVDNGLLPKRIKYKESSNMILPMFSGLENFEKNFYNENYIHIIIKGEKISSQSYYKDNGYVINNDSKTQDLRAYTISEIKINDILNQDKDINFKSGDIIKIYEPYYYKPIDNEKSEFVIPASLAHIAVLKQNEKYILYLQINKTEEKTIGINVGFEKLENIWYNYYAFNIDKITINLKSKEEAKEKLNNNEKYYGIYPHLYPEVFDKYNIK